MRRLDTGRIGSEADYLLTGLRNRIVGQDSAKKVVTKAYQEFRSGLSDPGRPIGNFLFLGPTGTGKTATVEAVAEVLLGDVKAVIKVDCAEFQHSHEIAKLIGSPPGYLGHRETHPVFSQDVLNRYSTDKMNLSVVLFDEIEKASDALWNLLLGIMDKAELTLGDNRKVDFSNAMVFMTSNVGSREMQSLLNPCGFVPPSGKDGKNVSDNEAAKTAIRAARSKFTPEFMNRIDHVVVFHSLNDEEMQKVLILETGKIRESLRYKLGNNFNFLLTRGAENFILREGTDKRYGARHLRKAAERLLRSSFSNLIATNQIVAGDSVFVDFRGGQLVFEKVQKPERGRSVSAR